MDDKKATKIEKDGPKIYSKKFAKKLCTEGRYY